MSNSGKINPRRPIGRVLLIESDEALQKLIAGYLTKLHVPGIIPWREGDPTDAILNGASGNAFDLIIIDWKFRNPSGLDIYMTISSDAALSDTPIILISGFVTKDDLTLISHSKTTCFLVKPFTEEILIGVLEKVCLAAGVRLPAPQDEAWEIAQAVQRLEGFEARQRREDAQPGSWEARTVAEAGIGKAETFEAPIAPEADSPFVNGSIDPRAFDLTMDAAPPQSAADNGFDGNTGLGSRPPARHQSSEGDRQPTSYHQVAASDRSHPPNPARRAGGLPEKILIVQPDPSVTRMVDTFLAELGLAAPGNTNVQRVATGREAWEWIGRETFDLILMEWNLKDLSGLCLYNRIRTDERHCCTNIIISCGFSEREDLRLLTEHRLSAVLDRPFQKEQLGVTVQRLFQFNALRERVLKHTKLLIDGMLVGRIDTREIVENLSVSFARTPQTLDIAAGYLLEKRLYSHAEKIYQEVLKLDPQDVGALSGLGVVYHRQNQPQKALERLRKANFLAPQSVERLCRLGEVGLSLQKPERAREFFGKVLEIDDENVMALAGVTIADNMDEHLQRFNHSQPLGQRFSSILNIIGITFVRNGEYERGIQQYLAAMCFLHDPQVLAKIQFNLGLAFLRAKKFDKAEEFLASADRLSAHDFTKPGLFLKRLRRFRSGDQAAFESLQNDEIPLEAS